ncbi:MAG: hypothetical protein ACR2RL_05030, partial [Gammaproteobacteria bacterium]
MAEEQTKAAGNAAPAELSEPQQDDAGQRWRAALPLAGPLAILVFLILLISPDEERRVERAAEAAAEAAALA